MEEKQLKDIDAKFKKYQKEELAEEDYKLAESRAEFLGEEMDNFKILLSIIKDVWSGDFKISSADKAIIIGAIIYVISPVDAIPDFIPVVGWIDDVFVVGMVIKKLDHIISKYKKLKSHNH